MNFWQFKASMKYWSNDGLSEDYNKLDEGVEWEQSIPKPKSNEPIDNVGDIVFNYNNKESQKYPKGIYLISKIISKIDDDVIHLEVIKDLRDEPFNYNNEQYNNKNFTNLHKRYNTTEIKGRVQSRELLENTFNPQSLYDFIMNNEKNCILPEEIIESDSNKIIEGAKKEIIVNAYERSPKARQQCIEKYGIICTVCKFNFEKNYGKIGKDFIHVHHLVELSSIAKNYEINPIKDLRPVCPNCHTMLHKKKPPYSIKELQLMIKSVH